MPTLSEQAYKVLKKQVVEGQVPAGYRLSDRDLSRHLGMSRTPVRQAIARMHEEGLVEEHPTGGFRVCQPDPHQLQNLFELREAIEPQAARLAAKRITEPQLAELDAIVRELRTFVKAMRDLKLRVLDGEVARRINLLDMRFHLLLLQAAANPELTEMAVRQRVYSRIFGFNQFAPLDNAFKLLARHIYRWHAQIARAVRRGDGDRAAELLRRHMRETQVMNQLRTSQSAGLPSAGEWPRAFTDDMAQMESDLIA